MNEVDIWRTAAFLLKEHGNEAGLIATERADILLSEGNRALSFAWMRIVQAIRELSRETPLLGECIH